MVCRLLLVLLSCGVLAAATQEEIVLHGRTCLLSKPRSQAPLALLLWLHRRGEAASTDFRWWHRSGLIDRGLAICCPPCPGLQWDVAEDRATLLHMERELATALDLPYSHCLIGGHGDGAQLAQNLVMGVPERFAGAILARGMLGGRLPEGRQGLRPVIGIFANINDETLPLRSLEQAARRLDEQRFAVLWARDHVQQELSPALWALTAEVTAASGIVLRDPPAAEETKPMAPEQVSEETPEQASVDAPPDRAAP